MKPDDYERLLLIYQGTRVAAAVGLMGILAAGYVLWRGESLTGRVSNVRLATTVIAAGLLLFAGINAAGLAMIGVGNASYVSTSQAITFYQVISVVHAFFAVGLALAATLALLTLRLPKWSGPVTLTAILVLGLLPGLALAASPITPVQHPLWQVCADLDPDC